MAKSHKPSNQAKILVERATARKPPCQAGTDWLSNSQLAWALIILSLRNSGALKRPRAERGRSGIRANSRTFKSRGEKARETKAVRWKKLPAKMTYWMNSMAIWTNARIWSRTEVRCRQLHNASREGFLVTTHISRCNLKKCRKRSGGEKDKKFEKNRSSFLKFARNWGIAEMSVRS